jgi:hypothetical protein
MQTSGPQMTQISADSEKSERDLQTYAIIGSVHG